MLSNLNLQQAFDLRFAYHVSKVDAEVLAACYNSNRNAILEIVLFKSHIANEHIQFLMPYWKREFEKTLGKKIYGNNYVSNISDRQLNTFFTDKRVMERWIKFTYPSIYNVWISTMLIAC